MRKLLAVLAFFLTTATSASAVSFTFDTGTDGFTPNFTPTQGALNYFGSGGASGGYIQVFDAIPGGGNLAVIVPGLSGDLSNFVGVSYAQLLPSYATISIGVRVEATNGDLWSYRAPIVTRSVWTTEYADFLFDTDWVAGSSNVGSLAFAIANVDNIQFTLETSGLNGFVEGALDSVTFVEAAPVPLPAAAWMMLAGLGALVVVRRRAV